jgi:ubiquinone/menaquinone biosynthesis C-methylase UbiE
MMKPPQYEYQGLMAEAWDVLRGDTSNWSDRHFYLAAIQNYGQPVLDVGCGTGRLLLDYLQQGIDIDGVDNSPAMLAICRRKAEDLKLKPGL